MPVVLYVKKVHNQENSYESTDKFCISAKNKSVLEKFSTERAIEYVYTVNIPNFVIL